MLRFVLQLLFFAGTLRAAQTLVFGPTTTATFTWPNAAPYLTIGDYRLDAKVRLKATPSTKMGFFYAKMSGDTSNVVSVYWNSSRQFCWNENSGGSPDICSSVGMTLNQWYYVRVTRRMSPALWGVELWDEPTGGNYVASVYGFPGPGNIVSTVGSGCIGPCGAFGAQATSDFEVQWIKWRSGATDLGQPRLGQTAAADLADWRFEGDGANSTAGAPAATLTNATFVASPVILPTAIIQTVDQVNNISTPCKALTPCQLTGAASTSEEAGITKWEWQALASPTGNADTLTWQGANTATPTVSGHTFGTMRIRLTVTDAAGTSTSTVDVGSVAQDSQGIVVPPDPRWTEIIGPQITWGKNPWPWADVVHRRDADYFGGCLYTREDCMDTWHGVAGQTATFTNGSATVTLSAGPNFNTRSQCIAGSYVTANVPASSGVTIQRGTISACGTTTVTLTSNWTGTSGTYVWGIWTSGQEGAYSNGSNNINYYDGTWAYYSLFIRSGLWQYLDYGTTLNERWWTSPAMNRNLGGLQPRVIQPTGMIACATLVAHCLASPNMANFWTEMKSEVDSRYELYCTTDQWPSADYREEVARCELYSLLAKWHPIGTARSSLVANMNTGWGTKFVPRYNSTYKLIFPPVGIGTQNAVVTNGSTNVSGTGFTAGECGSISMIWFAQTTSNYDAEAYSCTFNNSTSITLDRPYVGTSGTKSRFSSNLVGPGKQPFIEGWAGAFFRAYHDISGSPTALSYISGITDFIANYGDYAAVGGIYYGRLSPGCEPIGASLPANRMANCVGPDGDEASRFYALELLNHFSTDYLRNGQPPLTKTLADKYYANNFGKLGGPNITNSSWWASSIDCDNPLAFSCSQWKWKDFNFAFGRGGASSWPAARLGGGDPESLVTESLPCSAGPTGTTTTVARVTWANGKTTDHTCSAGVASIQRDNRMGRKVLVQWRHSGAAGLLVAAGFVEYSF